jgi:hypothetical protein
LQLNFDHHLFWLANRNDGLYRHNGRLVIPRVPGGAESAFVGNEIDAQLIIRRSEFWTIGAGVAHLFPGGFLKAHSAGNSFTYPYVFLQFVL